MSDEIIFKGRVIRCTYNSDNYKVYAIDVDRNKYPNIKFTKYGNATITGNLHTLGEGIEYEIRAIEEQSKYGYGYKVLNIKRDKPNTSLDMQMFLSEILTPKQAQTLYDVYPDIVDRVMQNDLNDIDLSKLNGIKEFTFNIIKEKIIENFVLVELVSEFQGMLSLSMIKKLYEKYTSVQKIRNEIKNNPYKCLCGLARVGFKTADSLLLEIDRVSKENVSKRQKPIVEFEFDLKTSQQRCLACILFLLEENESNGHTKMSLIDLKSQCEKLVPACSYHFTNVIKHEDIYYNKEKLDVALRSTYNIELCIANRIKEGLKINTIWNYDCEKYRNVDDTELTDNQVDSTRKLCKYNISILNGAGGTGKSKTVGVIIKLLNDNNKSFKLFAPTGRAAKVLSEYTKYEATTIHRGLGYIPPDEWTYNKDNKLTCDVLIIDEFSMADIFLFKRVLDAIDFNITKLLLVGDNAQLPSVSCGNLLHDFMQSNIIPTTTLTKVFRYGEGGLMRVATDVRNCKKYLDKDNLQQCTFFGSNKDYAFINVDQSKIIKQTVALYQKLLSQGYKPDDIQVLTSYNKGEYGSIAINNHLQKIANSNYGTTGIKHGDTTYFEGDLVIQTINNYKAKIYVDDEWCFGADDSDETFIANGEIGKIFKIGMHDMIIDFDGTKIRYSRDDLQGIKLGYSISIHKCLTDDTYIYTDKGIKQLSELNNNAKVGEFKPIDSGIKVYNGKYLESPSHFYSNGVDDCKIITTKRNYNITCTLEHGLDVIGKDGIIKRKDAKEIKINDYLLIRKNQNIYGDVIKLPKSYYDINISESQCETIYKLPTNMTEDFARFLGYMVADGTVCKAGIKFGKRHLDVVEDFCRVVKNLFGYNNIKIQHKIAKGYGQLGGMYLVEINSTYIRKFCDNIGGILPHNKYVPTCIVSSPKEYQIEFLKSIFEDGSVSLKNGEFDYVEFSSLDENLCKQIRMILLNMGIITTFRKYKNKNNYYIYIYKREAKLFKKYIGFISDFKNERLSLVDRSEAIMDYHAIPVGSIVRGLINEYNIKPRKFNRTLDSWVCENSYTITSNLLIKFLDYYKDILQEDEKYIYLKDILNNYYFDTVKNIEDTKRETYCLEMPETHKFIQNGISGWNSQGGSAKVVILLTPQAHTYMLNSNLIYVGLTRMKEKCFHLGNVDTVNIAIGKKENFNRQTFMKELLLNNF